jgi:hypothetical protein
VRYTNNVASDKGRVCQKIRRGSPHFGFKKYKWGFPKVDKLFKRTV